MKHLLALALFISLASCAESPQTLFEKDGVSITSPQGWKITDQDDLDSAGYYLSIEKDGLNSSGLFTLTWINGFLEADDFLDIYKQELNDNIIYRNSNLAFGNNYIGNFNGTSCQAVDFTASIIGLKHQGRIYVFSKADKTFAIMKQEALEDESKNKAGFSTLETSFKVQ